MPTLIHTSDIHLGAPLGWLGDRAADQRGELRRVTSSIVDLALDRKADCLLVAGDLFDSNAPPASEVRFAIRELTRFTESSNGAAVVLPGSHDSLGTGSIYSAYRTEFSRAPGLTVLGLDDRTSVDLSESGISIRGTPPRSNRSASHQLAGLEPNPALPFNVAVAHGSVNVVPVAPDDHPIDLLELRAVGWCYFALGHWHSWREIEGTAAPAVYPGAPEVVAIDQTGAGHVAVVELSQGAATVRKERVGTRTIEERAVDVTGSAGSRDVEERVVAAVAPDGDVIVRLTLNGLVEVDSGFSPDALLEALAPLYFRVSLAERDYHVRLGEDELRALPERLVVGRFARRMKASLEEAGDEEERREIEDALQLGVALLQGKDVLG